MYAELSMHHVYPKVFWNSHTAFLPGGGRQRLYVSDPSLSHSGTVMIGEEGKGITGDFRGYRRAQIEGISLQPFPLAHCLHVHAR